MNTSQAAGAPAAATDTAAPAGNLGGSVFCSVSPARVAGSSFTCAEHAAAQAPSRDHLAPLLAQEWDLVIIGGGITGAGILLEAARRGLKALLVEQRDFAWGTSSRSSKLVHGGLRYLKEGQLGLTRDSVRERQNLLREARGLVDPQSFAFGDYQGRKPGRWLFQIGLAVYDWLAGLRGRHYYPADEFLMLAPHIDRKDLKGGLCYVDAKTDDARMVLRVLQEARSLGGVAINYLGAQQLLRQGDGEQGKAEHGGARHGGAQQGPVAQGRVNGVQLLDGVRGETHRVRAKVVISATGAWADGLRQQQGAAPKLRPLRGSHLVFPAWRLPVAQAVSLMHPVDGRPVFTFPWEGATLVGTTDVDHRGDMQMDARITQAEVDYLIAALTFQFPGLHLTTDDVLATYAGVRPVIDTGKADPSKEGRDHAVWMEQGLLTVTGGKLTTFRLIALDALKHIESLLPARSLGGRAFCSVSPGLRPPPFTCAEGSAAQTPSPALSTAAPVFAASAALPAHLELNHQQRQRLQGHYGAQAAAVVAAAQPSELQAIPGTDTLWVELRWAARCEHVVHLQDLLLRRTRLGLLLRGGGDDLLPKIRTICQSELGWNDAQWQAQEAAYLQLWRSHYSLPQMKPAATESTASLAAIATAANTATTPNTSTTSNHPTDPAHV